ncbi:hypothetical protein ABZ567_32040 [Streptomyces sp. NPDC016459]|uniref:hypothetical protein n=1 Tax=Streptomyces sp. NPDC016459 TaxID=3157190 RepID=UPI0034095F0D
MDGQLAPGPHDENQRVSISPWPQMKLARATQHLTDLDARIRLWLTSQPVTIEAKVSDDRRRLELRLRVHTPPPVLEWSLILGDGLHALRSALDACVWELAHSNGAAPPQPRQLGFPVCRTRSEWGRARQRYLQTVPDAFADRIEMYQPYHSDDGMHPLAYLSDLDNCDKHRSSITVSARTDQIQQNLQVAMERDAGGPPEVTWYFVDVEDNALVGEMTYPERIATVTNNNAVGVEVGIETEQGRQPLGLAGFLRADVENSLSYILHGPQPEPEPDGGVDGEGAEWVPMNFVPSQDGRSVRFVPEQGS